MKKIITLLIAAGSFVAVHAQTSKEEARRVILGEPKNSKTTPSQTPSQTGRDVILGGNNGNNVPYPDSRSYPTSRGTEVDQINREYDAKINSIRNNPYLNAEEKERAIRQLEKDRARRIKAVRGNDRTDRDDDDDDDYRNKKDKKNNGKHLGWEKGKGNPHKGKGKNWKD